MRAGCVGRRTVAPPDPLAFYNVASIALECVCQQMNAIRERQEAESSPAAYPGCPCHAFVALAAPPHDYCCTECEGGGDGQLTVHVSNIFESENFPTPAPKIHPCKSTLWVATITVTIVRCSKVFESERGDPPTDEEAEAEAAVGLMDRWAALQALTCCLPTVGMPVGSRRRRKVQIASSLPISDDGGCAGSITTALVDAGFICGCEEDES